MKKGDTVIAVEGPHKGKTGTVDEVYRTFDRGSGTTGKRAMVKLPDGNFFQTRVMWLRPYRNECIEEEFL
jgi:hypothetical protein